MAVRWSSRSRRLILAGATALAAAGCASSAPQLPTDTTSVGSAGPASLSAFSTADAAKSCDQITGERQGIDQAMAEANGKIEGNRTRNQVAGYFGALLVVPWVATESNDAEKDQITKLYSRRDELNKLAAAKHCPTAQ